MIGRELDVAGVEGDAVEVLVAQHVAVVQAVREDPTEREAELAQPVAVMLRARVGEREVDVHAVGRARERVVARGEHHVEQVVADGAHGDDAVVVVVAVVDVHVAAHGRRLVARVAHRAAQTGALEDALDHRAVAAARTPARCARRSSSGSRGRPTAGVPRVDRRVLDRRRDVAEQQPGLDRAERDVGALAVGVRGGGFAVEPEQPALGGLGRGAPLQQREEVPAAVLGVDDGLPRFGDVVVGPLAGRPTWATTSPSSAMPTVDQRVPRRSRSATSAGSYTHAASYESP